MAMAGLLYSAALPNHGTLPYPWDPALSCHWDLALTWDPALSLDPALS